jgi:hypothetical protein
MKSFRAAIILATVVLTAGSALAQSRGTSRIAGKIIDEQGQPIPDVVVKAQKVGQTDVMDGKSNSKGEFTIRNIAGGEWRLEFSKEGLTTQEGKITVPDDGNAPGVTVTMVKPAPPAVDPTIAINEEIKRGHAMGQAGDTAGARKIYEALAEKHPTIYQFPFFIATTYAAEKNFTKALEYIKQAGEKDPTSVDVKLLQAEIMMELGQKEESKALLDSIDMTKVKDPYPFINAAITMINDGKAAEAVNDLTKLAAQFPTTFSIYYYRGRANLAASKVDEARADLEKFVSMAPADSKEVIEAKKILDQIVKK